MEYREHKKLHRNITKQENSLTEKLSSVARELYDNLTAGMEKNSSKQKDTKEQNDVQDII